jgi:hypothetical protein
MALAIVFVTLSLDETASLHETFSSMIRDGLGVGGAFHFGWLVPAIPLVIIVGVVFLRFVFGLPGNVRTLIIFAGIAYLSGVIGIEMVGGIVWETSGPGSVAYAAITTVEETLEIAGLVLLVYALAVHIDTTLGRISISTDGEGAHPTE